MREKFRDGNVNDLIFPAAILVPIVLLDSLAIHPRLTSGPDRSTVVEVNGSLEPMEFQLLKTKLDDCTQCLWSEPPSPVLRENHTANIGHLVTMAPDR